MRAKLDENMPVEAEGFVPYPSYNQSMAVALGTFDEALHSLVDDYRTRCLWFLRPNYYPETPAEQRRVLSNIQKYGDQAAHIRASRLRRWLSQLSSANSVGS